MHMELLSLGKGTFGVERELEPGWGKDVWNCSRFVGKWIEFH